MAAEPGRRRGRDDERRAESWRRGILAQLRVEQEEQRRIRRTLPPQFGQRVVEGLAAHPTVGGCGLREGRQHDDAGLETLLLEPFAQQRAQVLLQAHLLQGQRGRGEIGLVLRVGDLRQQDAQLQHRQRRHQRRRRRSDQDGGRDGAEESLLVRRLGDEDGVHAPPRRVHGLALRPDGAPHRASAATTAMRSAFDRIQTARRAPIAGVDDSSAGPASG